MAGHFDRIAANAGSNPKTKASNASPCAASPLPNPGAIYASGSTLSSGVMLAVSLLIGAQNSLEGLRVPGPIFVLFACASFPAKSGVARQVRAERKRERELIHPDETCAYLGWGVEE